MGKRRWVESLAVALGVGVFATAAWLAYGCYLRWEARAVLDDVHALTLASDRPVAFMALKKKYGGRLKPIEGCSPNICSYQVTVSNHLLSALFRVPYTELNTRFDLRNESLVRLMVDYRSAQSNGDSPVVHVQTDFCTDACGWFFVHPWTQSSTSERWNGIVEMGFATTPEMRQAALSLNPNCLTKIHGCTDIAQLLPAVWQRSDSGVRCIVPNREGQAR